MQKNNLKSIQTIKTNLKRCIFSHLRTIVPFSRSLSHQSEGQHSHDCDSAIVSDVQRNSCGVPHYSVQYQSDRILEKSPMIARRWHQARFGEMSSSSFEHVNLGSYPIHPATKRLSSVHNLYENTTPRESLRRQDKFINGPSRPLPLLPLSSPKSEQVSNVCLVLDSFDTNSDCFWGEFRMSAPKDFPRVGRRSEYNFFPNFPYNFPPLQQQWRAESSRGELWGVLATRRSVWYSSVVLRLTGS